jgi:hypothetical protein
MWWNSGGDIWAFDFLVQFYSPTLPKGKHRDVGLRVLLCHSGVRVRVPSAAFRCCGGEGYPPRGRIHCAGIILLTETPVAEHRHVLDC